MNQDQKPFILFLGNADGDGPKSKIKATGRTYRKKMLESGGENWLEIMRILEDPDLSGVVVKLTTHTISQIGWDWCRDLSPKLFELIAKKPHVVFVHETVFRKTGEPKRPAPLIDIDEIDPAMYANPNAYYTDADDYFGTLTNDERSFFLQLIDTHAINVLPYKTNSEMSVLATNFVDENERNLIFRFYVPSGKMWASESAKLLDLFRDYLTKVSGIRVRQDQYSTGQGVAYEFYGDHALDPSTLPAEFDAFAKFLDACAADPEAASQMLAHRHLGDRAVQDIVARYSKEARRLQVDLKQERERRILAIRHRMESDLIDVVGGVPDWNALNLLIDMTVPRIDGVSSAIGGAALLPQPTSSANLTLNIRPQIINSVNGIVAQEVSGTQNFGIEASQLLEFVSQFGGMKRGELTSAVYELEDADAKHEDRLSAGQKLKGFLFRVSGKVGDVALGVMQSYIESKLGL